MVALVDYWAGGVLDIFGGFLIYMKGLGVVSGSMGLIAPLRFKTLDSHPDSSNVGPFPIPFS